MPPEAQQSMKGRSRGNRVDSKSLTKGPKVHNPNQIVLKNHTVQPGPYRVADYRSFANGDTDITAKAASCNFAHGLIDYLDRYFAGWKLIRRVVELPGSYTVYKQVTYLVEVETDADAETIRSRLRKGCMPSV